MATSIVSENATVVELVHQLEEVQRRLRLLEDKEALASLMNRYCRTSDAKDWDGWMRCFVEDAEFDFGPFGTHHGREKIREVCEAAEAPYLDMQHSMTNMQFEIAGDTATGTAYLWFAGIPDPSKPGEHFDVGGPYRWEFRRTDQGWLLAKMHLHMAWTRGNEDASVF